MHFYLNLFFCNPEVLLVLGTLFIVFYIVFGISAMFSNSESGSQDVNFASSSTNNVYQLTFFVLFFYLVLLLFSLLSYEEPIYLFNSSIVLTYYSLSFKFLVALFSLLFVSISFDHFTRVKFFRPEFYVVVLFIVIGMSVSLDSGEFITLFVGLELQAICFYILFAFDRSRLSVESSLTYFIFSILSSSIFLLGVSFLYYSTGSLSFENLYLLSVSIEYTYDIYYVFFVSVSSAFIFLGFMFKLGLVPFHVWVPEVYEKGDIFPVSFVAVVSKLFSFGLFVKLIYSLGIYNIPSFMVCLEFSAIFSIIYGVVGALLQRDIKRLLGFSSIAHSGYVALAISTNTFDGLVCALFYLFIYALMASAFLVFFSSISLKNLETGKIRPIHLVSDLVNLGKIPGFQMLGFVFSLVIFSFCGIPPFAGFFIKFFVFEVLVTSSLYSTLLIAVFFGVVSSFFYLSLIRLAYFQDGAEGPEGNVFVISSEVGVGIFYSLAFLNLVFIFVLDDFRYFATEVASSIAYVCLYNIG